MNLKPFLISILMLASAPAAQADIITAQGGGDFLGANDRWYSFRQRFDTQENVCYSLVFHGDRRLPGVLIQKDESGLVFAFAAKFRPKKGTKLRMETADGPIEIVYGGETKVKLIYPNDEKSNTALVKHLLSTEKKSNRSFKVTLSTGQIYHFSTRGLSKAIKLMNKKCK